MFLKALTLKGFKSFAESTVLEMQPGVTVVVGPNGSGKSNVVDAIGWVLGAQAPSAVRSQKMEDVIFAGTSKRQALGRAEVSLTIDNGAGLLPIEFSEVTVTRTLWRSGESEYAINNVPCRLLDVQELFSDTGVGRQQHVIVGQGQIDAVLNARPEDRRLIIEEAAGVLKHRKRKERSERRLAATEGNLTRLNDLLREVRRQLRPLERQADAARRHGDLVAELQALQVFVAGRELSTLKRRLGDATAAKAELRNEERLLTGRLSELDLSVMAAESELAHPRRQRGGRRARPRPGAAGEGPWSAGAAGRAPAGRRPRAGCVRRPGGRCQSRGRRRPAAVRHRRTRRRGRGHGPRRRGAGRGRGRAGRGPRGLRGRVGRRGAGPVGPGLRGAGRAGHAAARPRPGGRRRREGAASRRQPADQARAPRRRSRPGGRAARLGAARGRRRGGDGRRGAARAAAEETARAAEQRRDAARAERHTWTARADALAQALDAARSRAGAARLAAVDGVVGTLLDLVDIDPGWEAAAEAACGEALDAVVVDSVTSGRRALQVLAEGDVPGAVLAMGVAPARRSPPPVGEPVLAHVRPRRPEVAPLLDGLLGSAVAVEGGWTAAVDAALAHPDAVVVTRSGGRFGAGGWRVSTDTTGATGAALDEARGRATAATEAAAAADTAHRDAAAALAAARAAETEAADARDRRQRTIAAAAQAGERAAADRDDTLAELDLIAEQGEDTAERLARDRARAAELAAELPLLEAEETARRQRADAMADARQRLDEQVRHVAQRRTDLDKRRTALADRNTFMRRRLAEVEERLAGSVAARREAEERRVELDAAETALDRLTAFVEERLAIVEQRVADMRARRERETAAQRSLSAQLDGQRRERVVAERSLAEARERLQRIELDEAEVRVRLEQAIELCRTQLDVEPEAAVAAAQPELADGMTPTVRVRELERELRVMGPVNPLALEEFEALSERHAFLTEQLDDVKSSRRELSKVIRAIDDEIVRVFAAAFADVSENFEQLFATLFPGGVGRLRLTDPDDLLNTGIEIEAKPSGKNVKKLSLLSGGERSLTALAYLFAVFRSRPSPFYVMDEVEAALDDMNLHRFLDLVGEFRREAQLIIVSHQKRTMEAADCLYGVTMQSGGSSKVVSEKVGAGA